MRLEDNLDQRTETTVQKASLFAPLFNVIPFSKYLALALFIVLPFVGGVVGYRYAFNEDKSTNLADDGNIGYQRVNPTNSQNFVFDRYSYVPEYRSGEALIDIEGLLTQAPFTWNEKEYRTKLLAMNENLINSIDDQSNIGCYAETAKCKKITVDGFQYRKRILLTDESAVDFHMSFYKEYLNDQGFAFVYEIAKGFQFTEVYQKNDGNNSQLIEIYSVPINLRFPDDGSWPTSDGVEHSIFVSSVFYVDPPAVNQALTFDIGHQSGKELWVTFEASDRGQFGSIEYDDISRSITVGSSTEPIIVLQDIDQTVSLELQVLQKFFRAQGIAVPDACEVISKDDNAENGANSVWKDYYLSRDCGSGPVFLRLLGNLLVAVMYAPQDFSSDYFAVNQTSIQLVNLDD